jgi:hypothetical protein
MSRDTNRTADLTERGIVDYTDLERVDVEGVHGEPVAETEHSVVYRDTTGHALNDWADVLPVDRDELARIMHDTAREIHSTDDVADPWETADPVVYDVRSFDDVDAGELLVDEVLGE